MPEIAEVETVRNTLKEKILHRRIQDVTILYDKIIGTNVDEFKGIISNKVIEDIKRIGKWLIFDLGEYSLLSHLRMEGKYFIKNSDEPIVKHEHIIFHLDSNTDLRYHDTRKFGKMILCKTKDIKNIKEISKLGYEPFDSNLTETFLFDKLHKSKKPIKTLLLDQTIINGLGNIYADEVLFGAKIHPLKLGCELHEKDYTNIIEASRTVIAKAIELGGTTIKSYTSSLGVTGRFQNELNVHSQDGKQCKICNSPIQRIKVGGRSTYYCDKCQK